jgi:hypothetical protein
MKLGEVAYLVWSGTVTKITEIKRFQSPSIFVVVTALGVALLPVVWTI